MSDADEAGTRTEAETIAAALQHLEGAVLYAIQAFEHEHGVSVELSLLKSQVFGSHETTMAVNARAVVNAANPGKPFAGKGKAKT